MQWVERFRGGSAGAFQLNIWIPDEPLADAGERHRRIEQARDFLARFRTPGQAVGLAPDSEAQCGAMLAARPTVISSIMGIFEPDYLRRMDEQDIAWFA